jgi:hypothetical protein
MADAIGGTIIQRSFIGRNASNIIHIATAPLKELDFDEENFSNSVAELLGTPTDLVLEAADYKAISYEFESYPRRARPLLPPIQIGGTEKLIEPLFADFMLSLANSYRLSRRPTLWEFYDYPIELDRRFAAPYSEEQLALSLEFLNARYLMERPEGRTKYQLYLDEFVTYDIPLGQSPKIQADSLLNLLETSKKFCVAPLALGGAQAISQLSQGNYVAALLSTGTAGAMTLILIGTVSVGTIMVQRAAQIRGRPTDGGSARGGRGRGPRPNPPIPIGPITSENLSSAQVAASVPSMRATIAQDIEPTQRSANPSKRRRKNNSEEDGGGMLGA